MLNTVPSIDELEGKYGFIIGSEPACDYVLLGLPSPINGPAFKKHGTSCIGAYAVRVCLSENIPYGPVCLAIWPCREAFDKGLPASEIIAMSQLLGL